MPARTARESKKLKSTITAAITSVVGVTLVLPTLNSSTLMKGSVIDGSAGFIDVS